jgi:hypothetical protein
MRFIQIVPSFLLPAAIGVFTLLAPATPVRAQNFNVAPMVNISTLRNGQGKGVINITNNGKEALRIRVYAEDFTYDRQGFVSMGKHPQSALSYIQFAPRELVIPPGVTRNVRVGTIIPSSLPNGEYRTVVFIEDLKERTVLGRDNNPVQIKARIASVFYFSKGASSTDPKILQVLRDPNTRELRMVVTNSGKRTAYPAIFWRIEKDGKVVAKDNINGLLIQSGTEREFPIGVGPQPLPAGNYSFVGEIVETGRKPVPFNVKVTVP